MKKQISRLGIILLIGFTAFTIINACNPAVQKKEGVKSLIDWSAFLGRNDLDWEVLPKKFDHGIFHGNGLMGCMIYQDSTNQIRWEMGHSDVTEHRRDNNRLPIGGMVLETVGEIKQGTSHLDLWNAESSGEVITSKGTIKFSTYIHAVEMVMVVDIECSEGEKDAQFKWNPSPAIDYGNLSRFKEDLPNPSSRVETDGEISRCIQERIGGGEFATAWTKINYGENKQRLYLSIVDSYPEVDADEKATSVVRKAVKEKEKSLKKSHADWWHSYYPKSFISVPDAQIEGFYWAQMYKLACATRQDRHVIDLLGPWYRKTNWPRIWWNLNIQIAYSPVYPANRLELGESFTRFIDAKRDNFVKNAKDLWGFDNCATVSHTTDNEGLRGDGAMAPRKYINPGDFTWALHLYWQQYRYSMDHELVTNHKKHAFYPLLKKSINLYLHLLKTGNDGKLHLPELHSPEYHAKDGGGHADNNYNLSLLRWGCKTLIDLDSRYGFQDPMRSEWERILRDLVAYPQDENGFSIGATTKLEHSHRHWSHLLMVWPLHLLSTEQTENRELVEKTLQHWLTVEDGKQIYGWSSAAAASIYATMGDGEKAIEKLRAHHNNKRFVMPNSMYIEGSPVIECALVAARSLEDMLIQSWGDCIRIFPAVPVEWKELAFNNLRTEGAFLVSASRKEGATQWIRVKSLAGEPCRIRPSIQGEINIVKNGKTVQKNIKKNDIIEIELEKGEEAVIYAGNKVPNLIISPAQINVGEHNFWGVKAW
jgi:alpha-L-fucosidase 2